MTSLFDLSGRVALVTGSSRGIGNSLARALAEAGATVVLNGINAERLKAA
ncbi:SDR family NAD(P)-dependent oxidoreductase, partial [Arthrobacter sp. HMWF013]